MMEIAATKVCTGIAVTLSIQWLSIMSMLSITDFYQTLMAGLRDAIAQGKLDSFADEFYRKQAIGDGGGLNT